MNNTGQQTATAHKAIHANNGVTKVNLDLAWHFQQMRKKKPYRQVKHLWTYRDNTVNWYYLFDYPSLEGSDLSIRHFTERQIHHIHSNSDSRK